METWIVFAILSAFFAGLYSFALKIVAQFKLDPEKAIFISSLICVVLSIFALIFTHASFLLWKSIIVLAFINGAAYYVASITRIHSLHYIHTTIYFPIYKTLGPIFATIVGVFYFHDQLSQLEIIGIILGIIVPLLLISKSEDKIQENLMKGLWFLLIGAIMTTLSISAGKYLNTQVLNQEVYLFLTYIFISIIAFFRFLHQKKLNTSFNKKYFLHVATLAGVAQFFGFYTFVKAMEGDLSVAFTINAFSILIPIVLSVWFFKEHMDFKKGFVIALSILSIIFFVF